MNDEQFYRGRLEAERAAAALSQNQHVREIHEELARQYEALLKNDVPRPKLRIAVTTTSPEQVEDASHEMSI